MKDTLPSMQAVAPLPKLTVTEIQLVVSLRQLLLKGYTKAQIEKVLPFIRDNNL